MQMGPMGEAESPTEGAMLPAPWGWMGAII